MITANVLGLFVTLFGGCNLASAVLNVATGESDPRIVVFEPFALALLLFCLGQLAWINDHLHRHDRR